MLTLDLMRDLKLDAVPSGQIAIATLLTPIFARPWSPTTVEFEGAERIPKQGRVILAMNHTDRYNYWPFQYTMWRRREMYTVTWVKGKYYNHPLIARFMTATNNIPTPSRGYLITLDATRTLGGPPPEALYRLIRDTLDAPQRTPLKAVRLAAKEAGVLGPLDRLLQTRRSMLGQSFDPNYHDYFESIHTLFRSMMDEFMRLNEQAFSLGHKIIVFPEGTRTLRLGPGRPGLAQIALRMKATIVPIGCNGSDDLYPGDSPISRGGRVVYRVGEPLTPEGALAPFQIDDPYTPFTREAEAAHGQRFQAVTDLMMDRINDLLDPRYRRDGSSTAVEGNRRFT